MSNLRKLIVAAVTAVLLSGCAPLVGAPSAQPLAGNPAVVSMKNTIGKTGEELVRALGDPLDIYECVIRLELPGGMFLVSGEALGWVHEYQDIPEQQHVVYTLDICLIKGTAVAETRSWEVMDKEKMSSGQTKTIDPELARGLLGVPSNLNKLPGPSGTEFEI